MPAEVIEFLGVDLPGPLVDCTLGLAGHTRMLLDANPSLSVIGLDVDEDNLATAKGRLEPYGDRVRFVRANFADISQAVADMGDAKIGGILADLGLSSSQIDSVGRGFSFETDGPLDMRMDQRLTTTAADLLNTLSEGELADLLYLQSQERHSRRIAKRICQVRRQGRLNSTVMLARLVAAAVGENPASHRSRIHPATRTFMALRMWVNRETESLRALLHQAPLLLAPQGRVAIISFHSGEDRLVKEDFRSKSREGVYRLLTKKPLVAERAEQKVNPRSRSAKMRVAELCRST